MDHFWSSIVTIATAIIGVAIIAVLVSNKASTADVITSATRGFAADLSAATNPFSGGSGISNSGFYGGGAGNILTF